MDKQLLEHYRAAQRKPVFIAEHPLMQKPKPFWPWFFAALATGAALAVVARAVLNGLGAM